MYSSEMMLVLQTVTDHEVVRQQKLNNLVDS